MPEEKAVSQHVSLKQELGQLIDSLPLTGTQKQFMRARWLEQLLWMESKAANAQKWYYVLRLTAIVGGVIVPALVSLNVTGGAGTFAHWMTFMLSLMVAVSVAVEEFFHYGERWRHYRRTVETLKGEAWQLFQLSGPYRRYDNHAAAYPVFAARIETIFQQEVDVYVTQVVPEKEEKKSEGTAPG